MRIELSELREIKLGYKKGLSLSPWLVIFNGSKETAIRLSGLHDQSVVRFLTAFTYLVNVNRSGVALDALALVIPEKESKILDGAVWARHGGIITTAAVVAVVLTTYVVLEKTEAGASFKGDMRMALEAVGDAAESCVTGGSSYALTQNMGGPRSNMQAHHIIPSALRDHPVLQEMSFHLDDARNGIFLPAAENVDPILPIHSGSHPNYNAAVQLSLDKLVGLPVAKLGAAVKEIQNHFRTQLEAGTPLRNMDGADWKPYEP